MIVDETYRPQFTDEEWPWVTTADVPHPSQDMCDIDPSKVGTRHLVSSFHFCSHI